MTEPLHNQWQLVAKGPHGEPWIVPIESTPFRIGRRDDCGLRLLADGVSRLHAEILREDSALLIKDCGSTNGTYVNFRRLGGVQHLADGDILHFSDQEFRVVRVEQGSQESDCTQMINPYVDVLDQLITGRQVVAHYQPIVRLSDSGVVGVEILGRTCREDLFQSIPHLFRLARQWHRDVELSLLFRDAGLHQLQLAQAKGLVLFNTVPDELAPAALEKSLVLLRDMAPALALAMEVNENAITDIATMRQVRQLLHAMDIKLVYDDFGAGQSRLLELMEAPPDILKFDISLIHDVHLRSSSSLRMVAALVNMARDQGVTVLAEGTEQAQEVEVCRHLGFELAQGFYFGLPGPEIPVME